MNSTCTRCQKQKIIKAKGLCNACYTYEHRHKKYKTETNKDEKLQELELKLKDLQENLSKSREENYVLLKHVVSLKEISIQSSNKSIPNLTKEDIETAQSKEIPTSNSIILKDLSHSFVQEVKRKEYNYDTTKYKEYLNEVMKKKKWYGLGEEKLIALFPCFTILIENYCKKIFGKRSKEERERIVQ